MVNPVGLRFRPNDDEIVQHYLRLKNLGDASNHFDEVMNTLNIYSFDPWELPLQSRIQTEDKVWYFFSRKENRYQRGDRQSRKTKSGYWKKTGVTMNIMRKSCGRSPREHIGEKRVLVFQFNKNLGGSKTNWVMHEYQSVSSSPTQMMTYTICRVQFKGEASDISSSQSETNHNHYLTPHVNNSEGLTSAYERLWFFDLLQDIENSSPLQQPEDVIHEVLQNLPSYSWESVSDICNNSNPYL